MTLRRTALLAVTVFLVAGCARPINRAAERRIRDALPVYIGPAHIWRAHVENAPERTVRGRLSRVTIDGEGVDLRGTIMLDTLHIEMRDVIVDTGRQRLREVGETTFAASIGEESLNAWLRRTQPPEADPIRIRTLQLRDGRLRVEAARWLLGREWPFTATVEPRLASPTRLEFDPDRFSVAGLRVPLPASALRTLAGYLSSGFDFSSLPFPLSIARFKVEAGRLAVEGTADVMQSLNDRLSRHGWGSGA